MTDKKTFIVVLTADDGLSLTGDRIRSQKTMHISGDKLTIHPEGYKIDRDGGTVFVAPHHQVRYMQEEKSLCDNAPTGAGEPARDVFTPDPNLEDKIGKAVDQGLIKERTTEALPRFTSLQEMAKDFYSSMPQIGNPTAMQVHAINSFVEFIENRLRSTLLPRR